MIVAWVDEGLKRVKRKLAKWENWKITKWQLKNLQVDDSKAYLTTYIEIEYDGEKDDSDDEFELILKNGIWMVLAPPT